MAFPQEHFPDASGYLRAYGEELQRALTSVDPDALNRAAHLLESTARSRGLILVCGNGGSAALAEHFVCDLLKGSATSTELRPRCLSLSSGIPLLTATANDLGYEEVFSLQIRTMAEAGGVLVAISSGGNSENIVRAVETAHGEGMQTIGLTGFSGGRVAPMASVSVHVSSENYGVVEDTHQSILHTFAQFIRHRAIPAERLSSTVF
ncbi:MAG: SIS domain-containing protein [Gemmatimonadota bacterium]